jgi:hypothetical protein
MSTNVLGQAIDSGIIKQEERIFSDASSIEIKNIPGEIDIHIGRKNSVLITADSSVVSVIKTLQENDRLQIIPAKSFSTKKPIKIVIFITHLSSIIVDGSSNISLHEINTNVFDLNSTGSSSFTGYGNANILNLNILGNGKIDFRKVHSQDCTVHIDGNGNVDINTRGNLHINIKGMGNIFYHREPFNISKNITGIGKVQRRFE